MKVIISQGLADGRAMNDGEYLESYDPDAMNGRGIMKWTKDKSKAIKFKDAGEAWQLWGRVSLKKPKRPDGKPNRPLTAFTILIEEA